MERMDPEVHPDPSCSLQKCWPRRDSSPGRGQQHAVTSGTFFFQHFHLAAHFPVQQPLRPHACDGTTTQRIRTEIRSRSDTAKPTHTTPSCTDFPLDLTRPGLLHTQQVLQPAPRHPKRAASVPARCDPEHHARAARGRRRGCSCLRACSCGCENKQLLSEAAKCQSLFLAMRTGAELKKRCWD